MELQILNRELQRQELQDLKGGNELQVALNNNRIINCAVEDLKQVLRLVMLKIGLRAANVPSPEETQVLIEHIFTNYANHTCQEIRLAFDMAIAGKLDVEVNCYENFCCLYFSNIMNAYRLWAQQEVKFIPKKINYLPAPEVSMSDEEFIEMNRNTYLNLKNYNFISELCYDILMRQGKIKEPEGQDRRDIISKAKADFEDGDNMKLLCRKITVSKYFDVQ